MVESQQALAPLMEEALRDAHATLVAVYAGGMFDAMPKDEADAERHDAGCRLLSVLLDSLGDVIRQIDGSA